MDNKNWDIVLCGGAPKLILALKEHEIRLFIALLKYVGKGNVLKLPKPVKEDLAKDLSRSVNRVNDIITSLVKKRVLYRFFAGDYIINPSYVLTSGEAEIGDIVEKIKAAEQGKGVPAEYVYLMKGFETYTKIGRTSDLKSRVKAHSTSNPGAKLLFAIQGDGKTEGKLHNHFKDKRIKLEWFDLTENDLQWIRENHEVVS